MSHIRSQRIRKAITKKHVSKKQKHNALIKRIIKVTLLILPIIILVILYLLCIWGIFCVTRWFNFGNKSMAGKITQRFILNGDTLTLTQANSVDLSGFHEYYTAGEGLKLSGFQFSLDESGVTPGVYGNSAQIPILTIDQYGRVTHAETVPIASLQTQYRINDMPGPDFYVQGTFKQVLVDNSQNIITLHTPQDIDTDSSPLFQDLSLSNNLYLGHMIYDSSGHVGANHSVLVSNGTDVIWQDINVITSDDQQLIWDPTTFNLSIENGNTVDLTALSKWKQSAIGGWYTTDVLEPRDSNVQKVYLDNTGWGLTELQIRNEDNSNNYSGAVLSLKGSGPDFTNNMFFAKLGDNYYVPNWAGKGVVSTDQPLIIASVHSNDPAHPNNHPYIMFQTGGYYTAPVDKMILDENGNLGIGDFSPDEKLTVAGNIHLTGDAPGVIHSDGIDMVLTTDAVGMGGAGNDGGSIYIHPGDIVGNSGLPKSIYMYPGKQVISPWSVRTGNIIMLKTEFGGSPLGHLMVGSDQSVIPDNAMSQFIIENDADNYDKLMYLVRFSDKPEQAPYLEQLRYEGHAGARKSVQVGDYTGGIRSYAYASSNFYNNASILFNVEDVGKVGVAGNILFNVSDLNNTHRTAMQIFGKSMVSIGYDQSGIAQLNVRARDTAFAVGLIPNGKETGKLAWQDADVGNTLDISIPNSLPDSYSLVLPAKQGSPYDVMYNDGSGNLNWDSVQHLLAVNVGAHAVLYSDGSNIVGDPDNFYWDWQNHRLGIGTTNPLVPLQVNIPFGLGLVVAKTSTTTGRASMIVSASASSPTHATRVEISNDGVFGTWGNTTYWSLGRDNWGSGSPGLKLMNSAGIWAKLGTAGGTSMQTGSLVFTTDNTHRAIITRDGNFGIGTITPGTLLQVGESGDGTYAVANAWQTFSDRRLKKAITPVSDGILEKVLQLSPITYKWKKGKDKHQQIGFIAQDVAKIFPTIAKRLNNGIYTIDYSKISVYLVKAIQELANMVTDLQQQVKSMLDQVHDLQQQVHDLKQENQILQNKILELENRVNTLEHQNQITPSSIPDDTITPTPSIHP